MPVLKNCFFNLGLSGVETPKDLGFSTILTSDTIEALAILVLAFFSNKYS